MEPDDPGALGMKVRRHLNNAINFLDGDILDLGARTSSQYPGNSNLDWCTGLDLTGISFMTKLLLLAAFICSRNKVSSDRLVFDSTYKPGKRRKSTLKTKKVYFTLGYTNTCCTGVECLIGNN